MATFLFILTLLFCVAGAVLVVRSFLMVKAEMAKKGKDIYEKWWEGELKELGSRAIVTITIWVVIVAFGLTAALYWLDKKTGSDGMFNYLSFAGPCVGALVIGLGILARKKEQQQPMEDTDFRYFFAGLPLLLIGYFGFIAHNPSDWVNCGVWFMLVLTCGVPLIVREAWGYPEVIPSDYVGVWGLTFIVAALLCLLLSYICS